MEKIRFHDPVVATLDKLSKELWWRKYRRAKHGSREQLSEEMILRKSLVETAKEYIKHCSITPVRKLSNRNLPMIQRLFWVVVLGVMCGVIVYYIYFLLTDLLQKPLMVTMDSSTYPISEIDFPAVAICSINRISKKAAKAVALDIKRNIAQNESLAEIEWFVLQAGRLLDYTFSDAVRNHALINMVGRARTNTHVVEKIMKELAPNCSEMLLRCAFDGVRRDCDEMFRVRRTMNGHCCAFNYVLEYNAAGRADRSAGVAMKQTQPGWSNGLNVVLDPMLEDYAYPISNFLGFEILLFDPTHFADSSSGRVIQRIAQPDEIVLFELQSTKQVAAEEVKKYPLKVRKCLFHDEKPEHFGRMYSYSACIVECRMKTIKSLCKCTPYFMPTASGGPMCTLDDLQCLNKYKEKLFYLYPIDAETTTGLEMELQDSLFCPECLPDCEFTRHITKSSWIPFNVRPAHFDKAYKFNFLKGLNATGLCSVSIYQPTTDGVLDRLDVVAYWFELLCRKVRFTSRGRVGKCHFTHGHVEWRRKIGCASNIRDLRLSLLYALGNAGGFAGMLLGLTIINIVELIYYFTVCFTRVICSNFRKYY